MYTNAVYIQRGTVEKEQWCMVGAVAVHYVTTPLFLLNSLYDTWQVCSSPIPTGYSSPYHPKPKLLKDIHLLTQISPKTSGLLTHGSSPFITLSMEVLFCARGDSLTHDQGTVLLVPL